MMRPVTVVAVLSVSLLALSGCSTDAAISSCSPHGIALQNSSGHTVELVVPDMGERPGWRKLAPNFYAQD